MIPGAGKAIKDVDVEDDAFVHIEAIIQSMTPEERAKPDIINGSRRLRIAKGAGLEVSDVNQLLKQFKEMKKMMKTMMKFAGKGKQANLSNLVGTRRK